MVKKKLLIIGGSSGIGSYLIQKLNSEYNIFATYNKNSFRHGNIKTFKLNLTMESNLIHNELSKLNIIPDALIYLPGGRLNFKKYEYGISSWQKILDINVLKFIDIMNFYLPLFKKKKYARILCFSSSAISDNSSNIPYACSKAYLEQYIKKTGNFFASSNILLNCIRTSIIAFNKNNWAKAMIQNKSKVDKIVKQKLSVNKIGVPEDLFPIINHLISSKNKFSTGSTFNIDGGFK